MEYQTIEQNDLQLPSKPTLTDFQQYVKKMKTIRNKQVSRGKRGKYISMKITTAISICTYPIG